VTSLLEVALRPVFSLLSGKLSCEESSPPAPYLCHRITGLGRDSSTAGSRGDVAPFTRVISSVVSSRPGWQGASGKAAAAGCDGDPVRAMMGRG